MKVAFVETPPPGVGVDTVIATAPVFARSLAGIAAVSCVALTNVVGRLAPAHNTCDDAVNALPAIVNVNAPEFTTALVG